MSTADSPARRRRRLSAEEQALWETVTRAVKPIRKKRPEKPKEAAAPPAPAPEAPPRPKAAPTRRPAAVPAKPVPPPQPPQPPLASLERRLVQRVSRGAASIDARLDLHGHTQDVAHRELLRFLRVAQAKEARLVLVITGKGAGMGAREGAVPFGSGRGVLRRLVPQWLALPEFRAYVIGYDQAHVSHGGEGALYVRVRRAR